ncbi:hypothetical protein ES702_02682 [subsurface metagenome]
MSEKRKSKEFAKYGFYIDTSVALDYVTGRNMETVSVLDTLKKMGLVIITSSFLVMEAADFKKDHIYVLKKAVDEKWEIRRIVREVYKKDLRYGDFCNVEDWLKGLKDKLGLQLYNFLVDTDTWELAQYISINSNLSAPDVIHLSSALVAAQSGVKSRNGAIKCRGFISNDGFLKREAKKIKNQLGIVYPEILSVAEIKSKLEEKKS